MLVSLRSPTTAASTVSTVFRAVSCGLLALLVWGVEAAAQGRPPEARPPAEEAQRVGGVHEDELQLPPASGRTLYVSLRAEPPGDGSEQRPWADLQAAFAELGPGDRLVVLPGRYEGPFVIGEACADGTAERPIEVWGKVGATFVTRAEAPVLTANRAHWRLIGLEITPGKQGTAALAITGEGARGVTYDRGHARNGWGDGVIIGAGASQVTITGCHIHHFGHDRFNREASTIRIEPGARDITIEHNNIHNMPGEPIRIVSPDEVQGSGDGGEQPAAENVVVRDNEIMDNWG